MLKILKIIAGNMAAGPATVPLPGSVPTPTLFRGAVTMNPAKCIGCGMCSYVCVSSEHRAHDAQGRSPFCRHRCPARTP